jgi:hypothetical protein
MATIHTGTTLAPSKLELLADWLPHRPWYAARGPSLSKAGGFRLDDPAGEVGIEVMLVTDAGGGETYSVPMTYRGAPLDGAEEGLIGTTEHGVLGTRWVYDAAHDPVAVEQLLALITGSAQAQHQSRSDTPDQSVVGHWSSDGRLAAVLPLRVRDAEPGRTTVAVEVTGPSSAQPVRGSLHMVRILQDGGPSDGEDLGSVVAGWTRPDGGTGRGTVALVR